ncbi:MAG: diguanylate cyclase [Acidobacteriota bacterium]
MPPDSAGLQGNEPEISFLDRLTAIERACLALVAATLLVDIAELSFPQFLLPLAGGWMPISVEAAGLTGLCTAALYTLNSPKRPMRFVSSALVLLAGFASAATLAARLIFRSAGAVIRLPEASGGWLGLRETMSLGTSIAFALLAVTIFLLRARKRAALWAEDILVCLLIVLVTVLDSSAVIRTLPIFRIAAAPDLSPLTLACLTLLTVVVFARQAKQGIFSLFLGRGTGSRFARTLLPFLVFMPFLREVLRVHIIGEGKIPPHYMTAVLATFAATLSVAVLIYLGRRFNAMEAEIQDLSLRDELTGLYNLRGFRLLAGQAHLLARRSMQPFSVLYVDLDGLKRINDELGHQAGSDYLVATAGILKQAFRETDVLARIGGDEFAVAGLFSRSAIVEAAARLEESAALHNLSQDSRIALSFSVGHVTSAALRHEALDDLLARADEAMYQEKRRRKAEVREPSSRKSGNLLPRASSNEPGTS